MKLVTKATPWAGKTQVARAIGYSISAIDRAWNESVMIDNRFSIERRDCPAEEKTHHRQMYQFRAVREFVAASDENIDDRYPTWTLLAVEDVDEGRDAVQEASAASTDNSTEILSGFPDMSRAERMMIHTAKRSGLLDINAGGPQKSAWMPASLLQAKLGITASMWYRAMRGTVVLNYSAIEKRNCPEDKAVNRNQKYEYRFVVSGKVTGSTSPESALVKLEEPHSPSADVGLPLLPAYTGGSTQSRFAEEVEAELRAIADMLIEKNRKYGDSALSPKRVFSKAGAAEQIRVRIDDKLSRMANQQSDEDEDVVKDLIGYLVLLRIATKRDRQNR